MRKQRGRTKRKFDAIVYLYSEGKLSSEIQKELGIPSSSYWRILADGGGMPFWAKIDNLKNRQKKTAKGY